LELKVVQFLGSGGNATVWEVEKLMYNQGRGRPASTLRPVEHMALKLSRPYSTLTLERKTAIPEEAWQQINAEALALEFRVMNECFISSHVLHSYGWGHLEVPGCGHLYGVLTQLCPLGSLEKQLLVDGRVQGLDEEAARRYMVQIASGLEQLHRAGKAIHRDLKPSNLLLSGSTLDRAQLLLSDFGSCKLVADVDEGFAKTYRVGTKAYLAPEMRAGAWHDGRVDAWMLGLILLELRTGLAPFWYLNAVECSSAEEVAAQRSYDELENSSSPYCSLLSKEEKAFLQLCLARDVCSRPSVTELCNEPYLLLQ
jgi:serine/threonine protein kinase